MLDQVSPFFEIVNIDCNKVGNVARVAFDDVHVSCLAEINCTSQ